MKKYYTNLLMAMMALTATIVLASCDNDAYEARTLNGTWTGYIDTYYEDRWGWTGSNYRTTIFFNQRDTYGGTGYEVDYDLNHPYSDAYYCTFVWEVRHGDILINYADSWNTVRIYDYSLNSNYFEGYMDDGTSRDIRFQLRYDGSFDWSRYGERYYYAPAQNRAPADTTQVVRGDGWWASGRFAERLKCQGLR